MYLERLALRTFRNLTQIELAWQPGFNVIWGMNAQGKTNLLEAIYLLGQLKSFRSARGADLIQDQAPQAWLGGAVKLGGVAHRIELTVQEHGRTPRVDGKVVQRLSQFIGYLRPILFTPEEMGLVKGYPAGRRMLLDRAILQTDPLFLDRAQQYERVLRQRNQLLREQRGAAQREPWDTQLVQCGARLRADRIAYLERFEPVLQQVYAEISGAREQVAVNYPRQPADCAGLEAELRAQMQAVAARERQLGQTLCGPHRDDPEFLLDGRPLRSFGSQGQQRSFLLAFKAAQVIDLETQLGTPPVLLLDDLASELDAQRQGGFFRFLQSRKGQVFITTTQPDSLGETVRDSARFFRVDQGQVVEHSPE